MATNQNPTEGSGNPNRGGCRLTDLVPRYSGASDPSIFMKQVKVARKVLKMTEEEMAEILIGFLDGSAFSVVDHLKEEEQGSLEAIKRALLKAFAMSESAAFKVLKKRQWKTYESVDSYLAEIEDLADISGLDEKFVKLAFVEGLPESNSTPGVADLELPEVVTMARSLVAPFVQKEASVGAMAGSGQGTARGARRGHFGAGRGRGRGMSHLGGCFRCGEDWHYVRDCPMPEEWTQGGRSGPAGPTSSYQYARGQPRQYFVPAPRGTTRGGLGYMRGLRGRGGYRAATSSNGYGAVAGAGPGGVSDEEWEMYDGARSYEELGSLNDQGSTLHARAPALE